MTPLRSPRRSPLGVRGVGALLPALGLGLGACSSPKVTGTPQAPGASGAPLVVHADVGATGLPAFYPPPAPLRPAAPGALIRTEKVTGVPGVPATATVWRVLFHSRSIYGQDIAESGYIV